MARQLLMTSEQFPKLAVQNSVLTAADLAHEAGDPALESDLADDGFQGAVKREFRGNSRDLSGVDNRVLLFDSAAGAKAFVNYMKKNSEPFFGGPSVIKPLHAGEAVGVLVVPPGCGCAGAYPVYAGVAATGNRVLWLEITGSGATDGKLRQLMDVMASGR